MTMITTVNGRPFPIDAGRRTAITSSKTRLVPWVDSELFIKQRHVRNCYKADPAYGTGVAKALGINLEEALKADR